MTETNPNSSTPPTSSTLLMTQATEKREVRVGIGKLDQPMTSTQAMRYGDRNMPRDLKAAGFQTLVFASDPELHGGLWFRISYGKAIPAH